MGSHRGHLSAARVLVACPNFEKKGYALDDWVRAFRQFTYQRRAAFMVDNTFGTLAFLHEIRRRGIRAVHVEPLANPYHTLELCWREISCQAVLGGHQFVASIEADVICPPQTIECLLAHAGEQHDVVGHAYPTRGAWQGTRMTALGCTLIRTDWLAESIDLWYDSPEQDIWRTSSRLELDGELDIAHLDPPADG